MRLISIFFLLFTLILAGCAPHYHTVKLSKGTDAEGNIVKYYAVTRNGVVIPEYVIDERGNYPDTKELAEERFKERKNELDDTVKKKYVLPPNTPYEIQRNVIGVGLLAVSPILIPIGFLTKSPQPDFFEEAVPKDPKLKDELAQIP